MVLLFSLFKVEPERIEVNKMKGRRRRRKRAISSSAGLTTNKINSIKIVSASSRKNSERSFPTARYSCYSMII